MGRPPTDGRVLVGLPAGPGGPVEPPRPVVAATVAILVVSRLLVLGDESRGPLGADAAAALDPLLGLQTETGTAPVVVSPDRRLGDRFDRVERVPEGDVKTSPQSEPPTVQALAFVTVAGVNSQSKLAEPDWLPAATVTVSPPPPSIPSGSAELLPE